MYLTWWAGGEPGASINSWPGMTVRLGSYAAKIEIGPHPGARTTCLLAGGSATFIAYVGGYRLSGCLRGPDLSAETHQIGAMLRSVRLKTD